MGIYQIKPAFQRVLRPAESLLIRYRVHPDYITGTALLVSVLGGAALYLSDRWMWLLLTIPLVTMGRTVLNALDGMVATRTGVARPWGEVLNEFSDRLSDVAIFGGLALNPQVNFQLGTLAVITILLSSYLGTLSKAIGGTRQYGGIMAKADRMVFMAAASVLAIFVGIWVLDYVLAAIAAGAIVTVIQRGRRIYLEQKRKK